MMTGLIMIDIIFGSIIYAGAPYDIKPVYIDGGENFNSCVIKSTGHFVINIIIYLYKFLTIAVLALLTYIEYNTEGFDCEMRTVTIILYSNTLLLILLIVINYFNSRQYELQYLIKTIIICTITIINYISIIWVRMYYEKSKGKNDDIEDMIKKQQSSSTVTSSRKNKKPKKVNMIRRIVNYHYSSNSSDENTTSNSSTYSSQPQTHNKILKKNNLLNSSIK